MYILYMFLIDHILEFLFKKMYTKALKYYLKRIKSTFRYK